MSDAKIKVLQIGAAHGIKGEVKLKIFLEDPNLLDALKPLTDKDHKPIALQSIRSQGNGFVGRIKGVNDRNTAETYRNVMLYAERAQLPENDEDDEFYYDDLIGLNAVNNDGDRIGVIKNVADFGAGDLLEIKFDDQSSTEYIPFSEQWVGNVNVSAGTVVIQRPEYMEARPDTGSEN